MNIHAAHALLGSGWAQGVRLSVDNGLVSAIETGVARGVDDIQVDTLLPAMANLHSHTFQRAMAGMTERRRADRDNFWTWRDLMYRFTARLDPDRIEAIAALAFMEMQEAGYAAVGEFHYIHHQPDGWPYDDMAELSARIFAAASATGIGLTHLPVLYTYGGAGQAPLTQGQRRFGNDVDRFTRLVQQTRQMLAAMPPDTRIGIAPHSLRATAPLALRAVLAAHPAGPVHIHIAEQMKEVEEIDGWLGARPVAWLLDNIGIDDRWCLIHATHMTIDETLALAASGATAGLCPVTEANLGDGTFNGSDYLVAGGAFGIGTDSNVNISMTGELRALEYSQRLRDRARNVMGAGDGSVGASLYAGAALGGARALDRDAGEIAVGRLADLVAVDSTAPSLCALSRDQLLDGLVFAASDGVVTDLWSAGRHAVQGGRHVDHDRIVAQYRLAIGGLLESI